MSRKSNLMSLLAMMMVAVLTVSFISCGGDDGNDSPEKPNNEQPVNPGVTSNDPEGTVSLSMRNADNGKTYLDDIYIKNENFVGASFSSLGAVKGLGNITIIPTSGWANQLSVIEGNGYVAYCNNQFYRIYVVSDIVGTTGGIIGSDIKYQKPFYGVNEAISIDENALTFTSNGGSQSIVFNNKNIFVFSATSNQSWCRVQKSSTYDKYFLYNAITINVDAKSTPDTDNAVVTLTTAYDKKVEIKVTRLGPEPVLELAEKETNISGAEQTFNVGITTNYTLDNLEISNSSDWLKAEIVNGTRGMQARASSIRFIGDQEQNTTRAGSNSGDASSYYIRLTATTNYNETQRTGKISISVKGSQKSQTLSVKQDGAYIRTDRGEVNFNKAASNEQCTFTSSIKTEELNVRSSETWCKATLNQNAIKISVENNATGLERNAIVTLYSNKSTASAEIKVTQTSGGIKFADDEITVPATTSNKTVSVTSDFSKDEMTISSNAEWCVPSLTSAQTVSLACDENPTEKARTANVTISDLSGNRKDILVVKQEAGYIKLQEETITVTGTEETNAGSITFTSNVVDANLEVSSKASWCTPTISRGTINFSAVSNPTEEDRSTTITIKAKKGSLSKNIKVTQTANYIRFTNMPSSDNTLFFDRNDSYVTIYLWTTLPNLEPISSDDSWCTLSLNGKELTIRVNSTNINRMTTINFKGYKESLMVGQCKYALGDDYNEDGLYGKVCNLEMFSGKIGRVLDGKYSWSTENVRIGASDEKDGQKNYDVVKSIPNWISKYPAFAKCEELNVNGINGWYIPAKEEITQSMRRYVFPWQSNFIAWSSTEKSYDVAYESSSYNYKSRENSVCAIHTFTINYK